MFDKAIRTFLLLFLFFYKIFLSLNLIYLTTHYSEITNIFSWSLNIILKMIKN